MLDRSRRPLRSPRLAATLSLGALVVGGTAVAPAAQASENHSTGKVKVVARNLDNPRGLAFVDDNLYIAEAGHGGSLCIGDGPEGPQCAGLTSGLSVLSHGRVSKVVDHLISLAGPDGTGAEGLVAVAAGRRGLVGQIGLHSALVPPQAPPGPVLDAARAQLGRTLSIRGNGPWSVLADTGGADFAWTGDHKDLQPDQFPDSNPNGITMVGRAAYVADAGGNLVAKVDAAGTVSTLAYLQVPAGSPTDAVPTCVAVAPDHSLYVGELLGGDFAPGHARVWRIADGKATVKWTGFTGIQGCGFDKAGNFYATEFQANGMFGPDSSGAVVKVSKSGKRTMLGVGALSLPSGFAYHDGGVYVSNWSTMPASNGSGPTGQVVRISVDD